MLGYVKRYFLGEYCLTPEGKKIPPAKNCRGYLKDLTERSTAAAGTTALAAATPTTINGFG
jgi:hypothetical protein